jgi:predicted RecB family nuclease
MQRRNDAIVLSASDLMRFQGCAHATTLDLRYLNGEPLVPTEDSASGKLIQAKGDAHERAFLETLMTSGSVHVIDKGAPAFEEAVVATRSALETGPAWIYQAALVGGSWGGYADFLERVPRPSKLGDFSYEVIDTKLKRTPEPKHVLQLVVYSDLLAQVQGTEPEHIHIVLGDGRRVTLRLADYASYARHLRGRLEKFVVKPGPTRPEPVAACDLCRWREYCAQEWDATDSVCLVAGIRKDQRLKLDAAGVTTLAGLAAHKGSVAKLATEPLAKLRTQARLQHARRAGGPPQFELRAIEPGLGLTRLSRPAEGDLFFDMEGDPLMEDGLEYLFGIHWQDKGVDAFRPFWAHDREQERQATRDVLAFFADHLRSHPDAHIYHYNHYEETALKRLVSRHGVGEAILDQLLREQRFVDLYRIVQQSLIASEPGYSIKDLEAFYADKRTEAVTAAGDSIVVYERWRETQDPALLESIRAYNEFDCRSTRGLRDWLIAKVRPADLAWPTRKDIQTKQETPQARATREEAERDRLRQKFADLTGVLAGPPAELLFELMWFHAREDKPRWWAMFDRASRETEELLDDLDSLGGLVAIGPARPEKRSLVRSYRFAEQESKLREGDEVKARSDRSGDELPTIKILRLNPEAFEVDVRFGKKAGAPPDRLDLIPGGPFRNKVLRDAVQRVAQSVLTGGGRYSAIEALLARRHPRIAGSRAGSPLVSEDADVVQAAVEAVRRLDHGTLPIQGPPGTGKTYVSSHAILALIRGGKRVAVTSNSHKAIDNLLMAVAKRAGEAGVELKAIKKITDGDGPDAPVIETATDNEDARLGCYPLVGGTAWLFARPEHDQQFDYLFVDEAGQVSLANIVATGTAARNIVLVGDPMQLAQPIQGVHPSKSGSSALAYLLDGASTVPTDRGIFLPVTQRLHPLICDYISRVVYDGRLTSDGPAARQQILLSRPHPPLAAAGLCFAVVAHAGNSQSSAEEGRAVLDAYRFLIGQTFQDRDGNQRHIGAADILVVTPYNAQVNLLTRMLPIGARVGTVDKFQGQEAPVCLISMATSSADELPRNIEFLFSVNRLNVAISRAQALAIVFASPRLLDVPCRTIEQMVLVNALCAVEALAGGPASAGSAYAKDTIKPGDSF